MGSQKSKTFTGTLEKLNGTGLYWTLVRLPFDVETTWGSRARVKVVLEVNGFAYRTSLFPTRGGEHFVLINKKVQRGAGISLGSTAKFTLRPDLEPREITPPPELVEALKEDRALRKWFERLPYSQRKWLSDIVADAKAAETRRSRAARVAEQVMEAMEAEAELPPMMRLAFKRIAGAEKAWQQMTERQRRGNLLAIFYYRTPQSRLKRLEKVFESTRSSANKDDEE
jgi:uncharacterized protein YdeI (YjbR/CyaY-like superfamily)